MQNPVRRTGHPVTEAPAGNLCSPVTGYGRQLPAPLLVQENLKIWRWLVTKGTKNAMTGLSRMAGRNFNIDSLDMKWVAADRLVEFIGKPEIPVVGVYLAIEGDASGHLMLVHDTRAAFNHIDIQMGLAAGTTPEMDEIGCSILGEMGNVTGAFFLNALADSTSLVLMPSPPSVFTGTIETIMSILLSMIIADGDNTLAIKAAFSADDKDLSGMFLVLPGMDLIETVLDPRQGTISRTG
jgi:chemotaxis protein CheC